jgi:hypothetical protein
MSLSMSINERKKVPDTNGTYLSSVPDNHFGFNLIKTEIIATESTEEHGNIFIRHLFFRVLPWIPWLIACTYRRYFLSKYHSFLTPFPKIDMSI